MSIALAQAPPADATRLLYERHSSRIFGFCLSRLGSREEAEDAVQTTFMNAQRGLGRGVVPEYELAWLFKIAQNVCRNRRQSARRRGRVEAVQDLDSLQDVIASPERSAGASLGELTQALAAIPARQRRALLLREFQGFSYEEIAGELGVSVAAVETLLFRARRALTQQLEQLGAKPARRRGAAASAFELFRWLFGGGAAPVKLAAFAAVAATTAAVAVAPVVREDNTAPAAPKVSMAHAVAPTLPTTTTQTVRKGVRRAQPAPVVTQRESAAPPHAPAVAPTPSAPADRPSPPATPEVTTGSAPAAPVVDVTAPVAGTLPAVTVPLEVPQLPRPDVKAPEVQLPDVQLPNVQLPDLQLPQLP